MSHTKAIEGRRGATIKRQDIYNLIDKERDRQDALHPICKVSHEQDVELQTMASFINSNEMLTILVEEVGEVAKALQEGTNLEEELIQVAAVCVRWLEIKNPTNKG